MIRKINPTSCLVFCSLCISACAGVLAGLSHHFPDCGPTSQDCVGSCSLPFFFPLFSICCLHNNCFSCIQHWCAWTISLFLFKVMVAILALKWHLCTLNVCSFQSAWNVFCVLHEVRSNSFDTRPHRLLTAQFCFTFWCCVTLYCSKNSI